MSQAPDEKENRRRNTIHGSVPTQPCSYPEFLRMQKKLERGENCLSLGKQLYFLGIPFPKTQSDKIRLKIGRHSTLAPLATFMSLQS